jgi:hypothetical protein
VEAAALLLPRATLLEKTELAAELDEVAVFHFPGVEGWRDLDSDEMQFVWTAAGKRLEARREANKARRYQRMMHQAAIQNADAIRSIP